MVIHSPSKRLPTSCSVGSVLLAAAPTVASALVPPTAPRISSRTVFVAAGERSRAAASSAAQASRSGMRMAAVFRAA